MDLREYLTGEAERRSRLAGYGRTVGLLESAYLTAQDADDLRATNGGDLRLNRRIARSALSAFSQKFGLSEASDAATWGAVEGVGFGDVSNLAAWVGVLEFLDALDGGAELREEREELLLSHAHDFLARHESAASSQYRWLVEFHEASTTSTYSTRLSYPGSVTDVRINYTAPAAQWLDEAWTVSISELLRSAVLAWGDADGGEPAITPGTVEGSLLGFNELQSVRGVPTVQRAA